MARMASGINLLAGGAAATGTVGANMLVPVLAMVKNPPLLMSKPKSLFDFVWDEGEICKAFL